MIQVVDLLGDIQYGRWIRLNHPDLIVPSKKTEKRGFDVKKTVKKVVYRVTA